MNASLLPLQRVAAGDSEAIDEVIDAHAALVWRVVRRRLGRNHPDLEDAMQDTFTDVWRSAARFDPARGTESAFIAQIAARRAIDIARKRVPRTMGETHESVAASGARGNETTADIELTDAMKRLRDEEQHALRLRYHAGMSYEQIAKVLETKPATIRGWVFRGLRRLHERLGSTVAQDFAGSGGTDHG